MRSANDQHVAASLRDARASFGETRLRVATAIAWEFWGSNRRGWQIVLAVFVVCALLCRLLAEPLHHSEGLRFCCYQAMIMSMILAAAFCNFTDRNRRDGIAGFPRHLFSMPVSTLLVVTCAMAFGLASVVGLYLAWAAFVFRPLDIELLVRWPAMLIAAGVVFYQSIIWCLCGFRLTRIVSLSFVATALVAVGFMPMLRRPTDIWATEEALSAILGVLMAIAYGATLVTVGIQRRGGARGWTWIQACFDAITRVLPRSRSPLKTADAALFWTEFRRAGLVLPASVLITTALILGPVIWFTGRGERETAWAEMWLAIMPILLAFPVGLGFGKPDFWSLDLTLSTFVATRPVTAGQLLAAKLKSAACSALLAWTILLVTAPTCIYLYCDTKHWSDIWKQSGILYSPISHWVVPILCLVGAILLTWSLLVRTIWLGYSGRAGFYYSLTGIGLIAFVAVFFTLVWWTDHPRSRGNSLVGMLPWIPWALAAVITTKVWVATLCARQLRRRRLVSARGVAAYACLWLATTACLVLCAWLMAPRIEWFRNTMMLVGLSAIPSVSIVLTPFTMAWNRHR